MIKYRKLSIEELEELEKEFIQFLAVNGIDAQKWQELKSSEDDEVDALIDLFSDMVMEKSLQNIQYIEHRTPSDYKIFFYDETEAHMFGIKSQSANLLDENAFDKLEEHLRNNTISLIKASKLYSKSREVELFETLKNGCVVTESKLFSLLKKLAN